MHNLQNSYDHTDDTRVQISTANAMIHPKRENMLHMSDTKRWNIPRYLHTNFPFAHISSGADVHNALIWKIDTPTMFVGRRSSNGWQAMIPLRLAATTMSLNHLNTCHSNTYSNMATMCRLEPVAVGWQHSQSKGTNFTRNMSSRGIATHGMEGTVSFQR